MRSEENCVCVLFLCVLVGSSIGAGRKIQQFTLDSSIVCVFCLEGSSQSHGASIHVRYNKDEVWLIWCSHITFHSQLRCAYWISGLDYFFGEEMQNVHFEFPTYKRRLVKMMRIHCFKSCWALCLLF